MPKPHISDLLTCFSDPGHSWLQVPLADIYTLGLRARISSFSFIKNQIAYLEEDRDMGLYLKAREKAGYPDPDISYFYVEHFDRSNMRRF